MNKVTIKDIAKLAGVSYATVSRALSGSTEIGEATRQKILKLCEELNYVPDYVARSMVMKRTNIIGLVASSLDNPFMSELINDIEIMAREKGYNLMVCTSSYDMELEKKQFELLIGRRVDGVLVIPSGSDTVENLSGFSGTIPMVFLSENLQNLKQSFVSVDNYNGAKLAVDYLTKLGHKKIAYIGERKNSFSHQLRKAGFLDTCKINSIEVRDVENKTQRSTMEAGYELGKKYFGAKYDDTAVFCASDAIAIGVMKAADERGIRIPEDVSIMGFDNIPFSALPRIDLTTIEQPMDQMAKQAVEMIVEMIETGNQNVSSRILIPSVVERSTCSKPRSLK